MNRAWTLLAVLSLSAGLSAGIPARARVVYVDQNAGGAVHDGTAWATAYLTIQDSLSALASGDEVWVAKGAYAKVFQIPPGIALYGGFAGTETARDQRDWVANVSALDGSGGAGGGAQVWNDGSVLDGLTIRNVSAGVVVYDGSVIISHCRFMGNTGDGVVVVQGVATLTDCAISGSPFGIETYGSLTATNCTITGCTQVGIEVGAGDAFITNSIVAGNQVGILLGDYTGEPTLSHNDVYGSTTANYQGLPDPTGTNGNISKDPLFKNATGGDLHLQSGSPCIDAGLDSAIPTGTRDLDGKPRIAGAHVDIGAYEFISSGPAPFTLTDVKACLSIAAGLSAGSSADLSRYNVDTANPRLNISDALRLARKVAGLDANP